MFNSNAAPQLAANYVQTAAPPPIVPTEAYELDARCYTLEDEYANIDDEDAAGLGISMTTLESRYKTQVISARAPARVVARRNRQHNPVSIRYVVCGLSKSLNSALFRPQQILPITDMRCIQSKSRYR